MNVGEQSCAGLPICCHPHSLAGMGRGGTGLGFSRHDRRDSGPPPGADGEAGGGERGEAATTVLGEAGPELVGKPGDVFSSYRHMRSKVPRFPILIMSSAALLAGNGL